MIHSSQIYLQRQEEIYALDFDDLILKTVTLFSDFPSVLEKWQRRFEYVLVDEFQDIDNLQYQLIRFLVGKNASLYVLSSSHVGYCLATLEAKILGSVIIATDIDKQVLEKAKVGLYNEKSIESVPDDLKCKYFTQVGKSYKISDEIKKHVEFREHNLLRDPYPTGCHLIVCRNVVIYFTEEAKDEIYRKFYDAMAKDGMLFIGSTEQIMNYRELNLKRHQSFFFQK